MNLNKIKEYLEANEELVIEKIVEAMKEAEGFDSSWRTDLLIDNDLEPWTTGMMSQNSFSSSVYSGEAFVIASGDGWNEDDKDEREYLISDEFYTTASQKFDDAIGRINIDMTNEAEKEEHKTWEEEQRRLERESYEEEETEEEE